MNNKHTKRRTFAVVFLVCFIAISFLSGTYIFTHADHHHDHDGANGSCATCAQIQCAENLLKQLNMVVLGACFATIGLYAAIGMLRAIAVYISLSTPVSLKIRMNN